MSNPRPFFSASPLLPISLTLVYSSSPNLPKPFYIPVFAPRQSHRLKSHCLSTSVHPEPAPFPFPFAPPDPVLHLNASSFHWSPQPMEIFVDDETKLTLHGLQQYYVKLKDNEKNRKLFDLLDVLEFNQVSRNKKKGSKISFFGSVRGFSLFSLIFCDCYRLRIMFKDYIRHL